MLCITRRRVAALAVVVFTVAGCGSNAPKKTTTTVGLKTTTTAVSATIPSAVQSDISVTDSTVAPPKVVTWTEVDTQEGSYHTTAADGSNDEAYNATARTLSTRLNAGGHHSLNIKTNVSFAPPDQGTRPAAALADYVMTLQANSDASVTQTALLGRPAFRAQFDVKEPTVDFDHADVTIDVQTGLLLLVDTTKGGKPYMRWETTAFNVAPDISKVSFDITPGAGDEVNRSDDGFIDTQVNLVKSQVGYDPLVPQTLPAGYAVSRVITHAAKGETTGAGGKNPQSQGVVAELFKGSGWAKLSLTTRKTGGDAAKWSDPLATVPNEFGARQPFRTSAGAMNDVAGEIVSSPAEATHLWVAGPSYVLTVSGPFSSTDLTNAANSLS